MIEANYSFCTSDNVNILGKSWQPADLLQWSGNPRAWFRRTHESIQSCSQIFYR